MQMGKGRPPAIVSASDAPSGGKMVARPPRGKADKQAQVELEPLAGPA